MDERREELKRLKKASRAVKRKHTALWSWLRAISLLLALSATGVSVCLLMFGGVLGSYYTGRLWQPDSVDAEAVCFEAEHKTVQEQSEAMEALQDRAVTEGAVLLKNSGVLPLDAQINVDILSVGSAGVTYDQVLVLSASTPEQCSRITRNEEMKTVLVLNTPELPQLTFLENVDACLWTGGTENSKAVSELLTGARQPAGSLPVIGCYDRAEGESAERKDPEARYADYVTGKTEHCDYSQRVILPFGFGLHYTSFTYSAMTLSYDVVTDVFTANVTVTNNGDRAGRETVQLYVQTPGAEEGVESAVKLVGFEKTPVIEPGNAQTVTLTADREALAYYDPAGTGGYVVAAGNYFFTTAPDAHTATNQILTMQGYTPENTEGRMDAVGQTGLTGAYTQAETDRQSYRLSASGAEVQNRLGTESVPAAEMPVTGASNGLKLSDLRGLDFTDPLWEGFLDQMTFWKMAKLKNISFAGNMEYIPEVTLPVSLLASGFDPELAYLAGKQAAEQCLSAGRYCLSTRAASADEALLTRTLWAAGVRGIEEKGIIPTLRLAETAGLSEQAARELLEPCRTALELGKGNIIADPACFEILKTEWGYRGALAEQTPQQLPVAAIVQDWIAGRRDPAAAAELREQCHRSLYCLVNSSAMNGVGSNTRLQSVQLHWVYIVYGVTGALWLLHIVMGICYAVGKRKWKNSPEYWNYRTMKTILKTEKGRCE